MYIISTLNESQASVSLYVTSFILNCAAVETTIGHME